MPSNDDSSGIQSYKGYEYQITATVWVALTLIIEKGRCNQIEVEPASQEDIEAALNVSPEDAESSVCFESGPVKLWIQIKYKSGEYWTPGQIENMITQSCPHGRVRAVQAMDEDADLIFNLITSSQANPDLRGFVIKEMGVQSNPQKIPKSLRSFLPPEKARRVGIIEQQSPETLELKIKEILRECAHVPSTQHHKCLAALSGAVRERLLGKKTRPFVRNEIESICRKWGGFPSLPHEPFVEPTNAEDVRKQLEEHGSVILSGPPGIGKTLFARRLVYEHQLRDDPFEVVPASDPSSISDRLADEGNILFFVEDPFGLYNLSEKVDRWITELPRLLPKARPDKRIVCTSRTSIIQRAAPGNPPAALSSYTIPIEEKNYTKAKRSEILTLSLAGASLEQKDFAAHHEKQVLSRLTIPQSIAEFARLLKEKKKPNDKDLDDLLSAARTEAISKKLAEEVDAAGEDFVSGAVIIWALLMGEKAISLADVKKARSLARNANGDLNPSAIKVFNFLTQTSRLKRHNEHEEAYEAHPAVLEGLESLFTRSPEISEDTVVALLEGHVQSDLRDEAFQIIKSLHGRKLDIPPAVCQAIDQHLRDQVLSISKGDASGLFYEFDKWYSGEDPLASLVHALMAPRAKLQWGLSVWKAPKFSGKIIAQIAGSEQAKTAARNFIRHFLPYSSGDGYPDSLLSFFAQFGWDLSGDFKDAYLEALMIGAYTNIEVLIKGACRNKDYHVHVTDAAITAWTEVQEWWKEFSKNEHWKAQQGHYNRDHSDHIFEEPAERFGLPGEALQIIVALRRENEGYRWIIDHPRCGILLSYWGNSIDGPCDSQELIDLHNLITEEHRPKVWQAIARAGLKELAGLILKDLQTSPSSHLGACLAALADLLTPAEWVERLVPIVASLPVSRQAVLNWAIYSSRDFLDDAKYADFRKVLDVAFEPRIMKALDVVRVLLKEEIDKASLSVEDSIRETLEEIARESSEFIALLATNALYLLNQPVGTFLPRFLSSKDPEIRETALQFVDFSLSEENRRLLMDALNDPDYRCRRSAMGAIVRGDEKGNFRNKIIAMASDPSAPVREVCARLIGERQWQDGIPSLLTLIADERRLGPPGYMRGNPDFHVARAAVAALDRLGQLPAHAVDQILRFVEKPQSKPQDMEVLYGLCDVLARQKSDRILPFLLRHISDKRFMEGQKNEGFPIRCAAAWGIVRQIYENRNLSQGLDITTLAEYAAHSDGRLAGPCLLALGMVGTRAFLCLQELRHGGTLTTERSILFLLGNKIAGSTDKITEELIPPDYPGNALFKKPYRWKKIREYLSSLEGEKDIRPTLRCAAYLLLGDKVKDFANFDDLRTGHLASQISVMTMRTLSGGE